jgi:type IV secretory pathway TraG/TraD family ATPase VirD4
MSFSGLGTYTFRAKSRSFGMWGRGGGSVSESDQRRPLMRMFGICGAGILVSATMAFSV